MSRIRWRESWHRINVQLEKKNMSGLQATRRSGADQTDEKNITGIQEQKTNHYRITEIVKEMSRKLLLSLIMLITIFTCTVWGSDSVSSVPASAEKDGSEPSKDALVVFFSATGTTKGVAEKIAAIEDADLYEIKAAEEYTSEDLDWNDSNSRSTREQNDPSVRPEIGSEAVSLEGYSTIYVGYPIWWGEEPRIMDTFVESYDFKDITMIPFCTSSSSGIGRSGKNLADNAGSGNWLDGQRFGSGTSEEELKAWIDGLKK